MSLIDQYIRVHIDYVAKFGKNTIVLCQTGSFYEVYAFSRDDWQINVANELLDLKIASKKSNNTSIFMCGFPDHAKARFEKKLLKNNYTVVYMEQSMDSQGKIQRNVTNVVSNGSNFNESNESLISSILFEKEDDDHYAHSTVFDTNTGQITVIVNTESVSDTTCFIESFVNTHRISEIITNVPYVNDDILVHQRNFEIKRDSEITCNLEEYFSNFKNLYIDIKDTIGFNSLLDKSIQNTVNLLEFVQFHNESLVKNLKMPIIQKRNEFVEKFNGFDSVIDTDSVFKVIDFTKTYDGSKKLREIVRNPLYDVKKLNDRYENIEKIYNNREIFKTTDKLNKIANINRINRKIEMGKIGRFDISKLQKSNKLIYEVLHGLLEFQCNWIPTTDILADFLEYIEKIEDHFDMENIENVETLNIFTNDKEISQMCDEINTINDRVKELSNTFTIDVKTHYTEKTGFFFETSKKRGQELKANFPEFSYQILTSVAKISNKELNVLSERFENLNRRLETRTNEKMNDIFNDFYYKCYGPIQAVITSIAWTDVFQSMASSAIKLNLNRPILKDGPASSIECKAMRHILVENSLKNTKNAFVPNDVDLVHGNYLLYGVNSVGKSVYLKSIGITILLAQSGMFVPASDCVLIPYKKIFVRFGNNDNLARNHSSFINEIYEIETIVSKCDQTSLILADECCSSTEIKSAIEIVSTTLRWLTDKKASFVFSSHFFELIESTKHVENLSIAYLKVVETEKDIVFERKLTLGIPENINYGTKIAKTVFTNTKFKKMLEQSKEFKQVKSPKSRYNSNVVVKCCTICSYSPTKSTDLPLDVHHIDMQADANQDGFVGDTHKNIASNLVVLCKSCHQKTHQGFIRINGWNQSLSGNALDFEVTNERFRCV